MALVGGFISLGGGASIDYTSLLTSILTETQSIDSNTDQLESLVGVTNTSISGLQLTLDSVYTELQSIDDHSANIDSQGSLNYNEFIQINSNTFVTSERLNDVNTNLTSIINKLNEPCAGSPINVSVCNPTDISGLQTVLDNILLQDTDINQNTLFTQQALANTNILLGTIDTSTSNSLIEQQLTNTNLNNILTKLNEDCAGDPINVRVCPEPSSAAVITSGTTSPIPAGATSILIRKTNGTGTVTVAGQILSPIRDNISFDAPEGKTLPAITLVAAGGGTFAWTAIT
jgi:hypothetical protein